MKVNFFVIIFMGACFIFIAEAFAGADRDTLTFDSTATMRITTAPSGATIILDSSSLGTTPLEVKNILPGVHILHYIHPEKNSWLHPSIEESLIVKNGQHVERDIHFPLVYHITSDPFGASVIENDSIIGKTPMILSTPSGLTSITLTKNGYENAAAVLPSAGGEVHVQMEAQKNISGNTSDLLMNDRTKNSTHAYIVSGAAVVSGVVAAYFKIKADGRYADYRNTGDTGILTEVHRFDTISGVALVSCQASLILLSYLLLSK